MGAEVVVGCWVGGEEVVARQPLVGVVDGLAAGGGGGCHSVAACCRVRLPANLDAAPLQVHLVATGPGHEGVLLGTATSMCLPVAAARQLLDALPQPPDSDPELLRGFFCFLTDMAAAWRLLFLEKQEASQGPTTAQFILARLSDYCASERLPAVAAFLCELPRRAGATDGALPAFAGPAVATLHTTAAPVTPTPAAPTTTPPAATATAQPTLSRAPHAPRASSSPATPSLAPASSSSSSSSSSSNSSGTGSSAAPPPSTATTTAITNTVPQPGSQAWEQQYTTWKLQQGRRLDLLASQSGAIGWGTIIVKQLLAGGPPAPALRSALAFAASDTVLIAAPMALLALGPDSLRSRRTVVIWAQVALVGARNLAAAACWLSQPPFCPGSEYQAAMLFGEAVFIPAMQRVGWRQQLLCSLVGIEATRYLMHAAASSCTPGTPPITAPSLWHLALLPLVAAAVSWALDRCSRVAFGRMLAHPQRLTEIPAGIKNKDA